jgi:endonuclease/exonuclease/phosphatase family metal-dependent hydrolase
MIAVSPAVEQERPRHDAHRAARAPAAPAQRAESAPDPRTPALHAAQLRADASPRVGEVAAYGALLNAAPPAQRMKRRKPDDGLRNPTPKRKKLPISSRRLPRPVPPPPTRVGIGTYNINHLGSKSDKGDVKLDALRHLMASNPWLDLLALQEVNDPEVLDQLADDVEVLSPGPVLRTIGVSGGYATRELYPILARKGSGWKSTGTSLFFADDKKPETWEDDGEPVVWRNRTEQGEVEGELAESIGRPTSDDEGSRDQWYNEQRRQLANVPRREKKKDREWREAALELAERRKELQKAEDKRTRPVVIHHLEDADEKKLNVAVVHTTPSGQEFGRRDVFAQVSSLLKHVDGSIDESGEDGSGNWVILGDFYLTPEAQVDSVSNRKQRNREKSFGLHFPDPVSELMTNGPEPRYPNLSLAHSISASNWPVAHQGKKREAMQIADFMIVSSGFKDSATGVFDPYGEGIWPVDLDHRNLERWMAISDHAPIGAMLSTGEDDRQVSDVRFGANRRAFPPEMREIPDLLSSREMEEKGEDPELDLSTQDSFFFLEPQETLRLPEGIFNQFTHNVPEMAEDLVRLFSPLTPQSGREMERTLGSSTSLADFADTLPSGRKKKLGVMERRRIWNEHRREKPPQPRGGRGRGGRGGRGRR